MQGRHAAARPQTSTEPSGKHRSNAIRRRKGIVSTVCLLALTLVALSVAVRGTGSPSVAATTNASHVQSAHGYVNHGRTVRATLPNATKSGDLLAVHVVWSNRGSASVSDNGGDRLTSAGTARTRWDRHYSSQVFLAKNVAGGATTVRANLSRSVSFAIVYVDEYAGIDTSNPVDATRSATGTGTTLNSGSVTTSKANDLLYGAGASVGSVSSGGSGYTVRSLAGGNIIEDRLAGATGAYDASATHGGGRWVMQLVALKPRAATSPSSTSASTTSSTSSTSKASTSAASSTAASSTSKASTSKASTSAASSTAASSTSKASTSAPASTTSSAPSTSKASSTTASSSTSTTSAPGQRSCPAYPSFPDASCTGVPAGQSLTVVSSDQTYGSSANGTTISNKDFHGWVTVTGANITFKNCIFRGRAANGSNHGLLDTESSSGTITVTDSEFVPSNPSATIDGIWAKNTTIIRANIHGSVDGMKAETNTLVQDSWIHDMSYFASDPNQGGGETHNDGVQSYPPGETNVTLRHNRIDLSGTPNANAAMQSSAYNARIENNYLDGGGCTLNFDAQPLNGATLQPLYVNNNRFGRHQSFTGCVALISNKTVMTEYNGNVWADNGQPVPKWQQHD